MQITKLTKRLLDNYVDCCNALERKIKEISILRLKSPDNDSVLLTIFFTIANILPMDVQYRDFAQAQYIDENYQNEKPCMFTLEEIEPALLDDIILTDEEKKIIKLLIKKYYFECLTKNLFWDGHPTIISLSMRDTNTTIDLIDLPNNIGFKFEPGLFKGLANGKEYKREDFNFLEEQEDENN